ncbi:MAG: Uncharacterised protein [Cryomorphaceae bacterium]|nr:MAG: Uncharacterised protein [Cryomorphaceae bacterium]
MKKVLLSLGVFALSLGSAYGQYYHGAPGTGNPGTQNTEDTEYPVGSGLPTDWSSILGAAQTAGTYSPAQTIPFDFMFNGDTVTTYRVSNTGILTFSQAAAPAAHPSGAVSALSASTVPDSSVCILGVNGSGSNDQIARKTFGTAPNRQEWIIFASYSATGTSTSHWTYWSIVLEEGSNNIHIVDQRTAGWAGSLNIGVRVDATTIDEIAGVTSGSTNAPDRTDNTHYTFIQGVQPEYEMAGNSVNLNPYLALTSAPFTIGADFVNNGSQTVTSADLNISVNGGAAQTSSLSNLSIASLATGTAVATTAWTPSATGNYEIKAWLSNLNGTGVDADLSNDTASITVQVVPALTTRYPLYETFTSSTCPPCVPANINMETIFAANPGEANSIKYQMSWPGSGDPYYYAEGGDRRTYYAVNSVPNVAIDGGWNANGNNLSQQIFDDFQAVPSFVEMSATFSKFSQTIETTVTIDPLADNSSSNLALFAVIYSKRDTANVGTNGETEFIHVVKKMMPSSTGQSLSGLTAGTPITQTLSYTFNGNYRLPANAGDAINLATEHTVEDFDNLGVILWIQDAVTKEVLQSTDASYTIGQFENELAASLNIYPNPATDRIFVEADFEGEATARLISMLGQEIKAPTATLSAGQRLEISTSDLAPGTYLLVVSKEGTTHATPVIVQ